MTSDEDRTGDLADPDPATVDEPPVEGAVDDASAVIENAHLGRFELLHRGDIVSYATYRQSDDGTVTVPHVETAVQHRGNGHAARLMEGMLAILRSSDRKIRPLCPFAADHIRDNPQHADLLP